MNTAPALVADIGGTNSRLALADGPALRPGTLRSFANDDHGGLQDVVTSYLGGSEISGLCLAAAGVVSGDAVRLSNRPTWATSRADLAALAGTTRIALLNDLQALGHALADPVVTGRPMQGTRLVVAVGTGVNAAIAIPGAQGLCVPAAEYGTGPLPFTTPADAALFARLASADGAPIVESLLSGPGIERAYRLLSGKSEPAHRLAQPDHPDREARAALALVLRVFGRFMAGILMATLPRDGAFIAGSVGRALFALMDRPDFRDQFLAHAPSAAVLSTIPCAVIDDDAAALVGAARYLAQIKFTGPPQPNS